MDLTLNNLQWLMCNKPNQTKSNQAKSNQINNNNNNNTHTHTHTHIVLSSSA